jgi:hypothetical protein
MKESYAKTYGLLANQYHAFGFIAGPERLASVQKCMLSGSGTPLLAVSAATPSTDLPLDLPADLAPLSSVYEELKKQGTADGLKRAYVNLSCILSSSLKEQVLSVYAHDDGNDVACVSANGTVVRMAARCGDEVVGFENGQMSRVLNESEEHVLHQIVSEQFESFTGHPGSSIHLGSFDAPENRGFVVEHRGT